MPTSKTLRSAEKREIVGYLADEDLSIRQVCVAINLSLSVYYYRFKRKAEDTVIMRHLEQWAEKYHCLWLPKEVPFTAS